MYRGADMLHKEIIITRTVHGKYGHRPSLAASRTYNAAKPPADEYGTPHPANLPLVIRLEIFLRVAKNV